MNLDISTNAIRAKVPSSDPSVLETVQTATNLVQDLRALKLLQDYLSRVSGAAADTSDTVIENPAMALKSYTQQMRNFIVGYLLTHDESLSPLSEIQSSKIYQGSASIKDPQHFESILANNLLVPAIPGNLFYMSCGENLEEHNLDLYNTYQTVKSLPENVNKLPAEIIASLIPLYPVSGLRSGANQIPQVLLSRWASILDMTAENTWTIDNLTVTTELEELIPIIGLRSITNYKAFMSLRILDRLLEEIPYNVAAAMKSLYQQAGQPNHPEVWLSNLKYTLRNPTSISEILMSYFTEKNLLEEYLNTWNSLSAVPSNSNNTPTELVSVLSSNSNYQAAAAKSTNYINNFLSILLSTYGGSNTLTSSERVDLFTNTFETWKTTLSSFGGILGAEGLIAIVAINQLNRISNYSAIPTANDELLTKLGKEGLAVSSYLSNAQFLESAFAGLAA